MTIIFQANEYGETRESNGCKHCEFELTRPFTASEAESLKLIQPKGAGWTIEFYTLRDNSTGDDHHFLDCHGLLRPMLAGWLESLS